MSSRFRLAAEALKGKLLALAKRKTRRSRRPRPAEEAERAAVHEVVGWRCRWEDYMKRHGAKLTVHLAATPEWRRHVAIGAAVFNTPDVTSNNPFHIPISSGIVDEQYSEQWRRYWFATPARRRVVREALEIQEEREKARKQRGRVGWLSRDVVFRLSQGRCGVCGRRVSRRRFHLDHRKALARGGRHAVANAQVTCPRCNLRKGISLSELRKIYSAELAAIRQREAKGGAREVRGWSGREDGR